MPGEIVPVQHGVVVPVPRRTYAKRDSTLTNSAAQRVFESHPKRTRETYQQRWSRVLAACDDRGWCPYPMTAETLANVLDWIIEQRNADGSWVAPSTLVTTMSAVRTYHRMHALREGDKEVQPPDPYLARRVIKRYREQWTQAGNRPKAADPLTHRELKLIRAVIDFSTIKGVRDWGLFLLGHGHKSRRNELCTLDIGDIRFTDDGMWVNLPYSKTDQEGRGAETFIPRGKHPETCWVTAVHNLVDLMTSRGITSGPLFQPIDLHGNRFAGEPGVDPNTWVGGERGKFSRRLTGAGVWRVVKKWVTKAGLSGRISPHSVRAGGMTDHADAGADATELAEAGRYSVGSTVPQRYVRRSKHQRTSRMKNINM